MPEFDTGVPHIARIYDYWLGGKDNFAADRDAAELAMAATPTIVPGVRANRRFLGRAVRFMAEAGVRQFLDVGTGIPATGNTHEAAEQVAPDPGQIVAGLMRPAASGSFAALSHPARDQVTAAIGAETSLTKSMGQKVTFRTRDEVAGLAAGLDLVDPGVVPVQEWRPDSPLDTGSAPTTMWGFVARKP